MSSAILYLAIIAIWACVLIPRWLRRDSTRGVPAQAPAPVIADSGADSNARAEDGLCRDAVEVVAPAWTADPLSAGESRRRMLAARRRLLLMLIGLEAAAITLAVFGLAAIWVVAPPSIMLIGYLLLLREAARADTERARREAEAVAYAQERERIRMAQGRRPTPVEGTPTEAVTEAAAVLAAKFAAAPVPADYEDSGRDFAPGLAGKYTTSNADAERYADDDQPHLRRAVGD